MESQEFITQKDKLEFRQIVLQHLKKILDLSLRIVPQQYKLIFAEAYADSIRCFSDVLLPHYDKNMNEAYTSYQKRFNSLQKMTKGNQIAFLRNTHRELFRQLNLLMGRIDYLKQSIYTEGDEDI